MTSLALVCGSICSATTPGDRGNDVNVTFPSDMLVQNGGYVIDVTNPPSVTPAITAAVGNGTTDNTAAFQSVFNFLRAQFQASINAGGPYNPIFSNSNLYYVYIPNGTYKVSGTISYTGADQEQPAGAFNGSNFDINRVTIVGQSRAGTIIQLANNASNFQNASSPQPVIAYQNMQTDFNNVPGSNILRNVTVNTGTGNPGAAGVFFQGANTSNMSNVTIQSGDGQGVYGLWFKIGSNQGFYTDMTITGFQYGIYDAITNTAEGAPAIEYVTLNNQTVAGIGQLGMSMSLRGILSNQSSHGVSALKLSGTGISTVMVDSNLTGGSSSQPAINMTANSNNGQSLFARNITTSGYGEAIQQGGSTVVAVPNVTEWVAYPVTTLFSGQDTTSLNLPVVDTPQVAWGNPSTDWAEVDDYPSVQAAFNSGKPIIVFRKQTYSWSTAVTVPASVQFINLMGANVSGDIDISTASSTPLLVQDGNVTFLKLEAQRDVILRMVGQTMYNLTSSPVNIYLEATGNIEPSDSYGSQFCVTGQHLWARNGFDQENENVNQIIDNGCTEWVFGFKTEQEPAGPLTVENGGSLEVLGGYVNQTSQEACASQTYPLINVVNADASVTALENQAGTNYCTVVSETRGTVTETASDSQFPLSGIGSLKVIPLYVGTGTSGGAPAPPTGVTATTVSSSQINVSWTASSGATSYNVGRSTTSGGPYSTIATGVTSTSYSDTGLSASTTYYYVVQAVNAGGTSANSSHASATTQAGAPAPPTGLTATTVSTSQITLSWTASSGATSYNVGRSATNGGPYTTIATGVATTSYSNTGLTAGTTYYYVVQAVSSGGTSGNSSQASAITISGAPTGLSATATSSSQINLTWTGSTGAASYSIGRSTTSGGPYTTVATGVATTSYSNTGLAANTTYYYVVQAINAGGTSANSTQASATTQAVAISFARAAQNFVASGSSVSVTMPNNAGDVIVLAIRLGGAGGQDVPSTAVTDTAGNTYTLVNSASQGGGHDRGSALFVAKNIVASSNNTITFNTNNIVATWPPLNNLGIVAEEFANVVSVDVNLSATSGYNQVTTLSSGSLTTTSTGDILVFAGDSQNSSGSWTPGSGYAIPANGSNADQGMEYSIAGSAGAYSTSITCAQSPAGSMDGVYVALKTQAGAPAPPTGLTATTVSTSQINLSWTPSSGAASYNVLRSATTGGPYTQIASGVATTSYSNTGLTAGTTYYYVVQAVSSGGTSGNSSQASAITISAAPTGLTANAVSGSQINLTWIGSTGAASYSIGRSTTSGGPYATVATGVATTSYSNTGLAASTTYYYVVQAVNAGGTSANSTQANATTQAGGGQPISFVRATNNLAASGISVSVNMANSAGDVIVVGVRLGGAGGQDIPSTAVTDTAGNTYTLVNSASQGAGHDRGSALFVAKSIVASSNNTITFNTNNIVATWPPLNSLGIVAEEFANVGSVDVNRSVTSGYSQVTSLSSGSLTTTGTGDALIFAGDSQNSSGSWTPGSGYTIPANGSNANQGMEYFIAGNAGAYSTSITCAQSPAGSMDGVYVALKH